MNKIKSILYIIINIIFIMHIDAAIAYASATAPHKEITIKDFFVEMLMYLSVLVIVAIVRTFIEFYPIIKKLFRPKEKHYLRKMRRLTKRGLKFWKYEYIISTVTKIYYEYYNALTNSDVCLIKDYLEKFYYSEVQNKINELKSKGDINVFKDVKLKKISIVNAQSYKFRNSFSVKVTGSMIDVIVKENAAAYLGDKNKSKDYTEIWTFEYINENWRLINIESTNIYYS